MEINHLINNLHELRVSQKEIKDSIKGESFDDIHSVQRVRMVLNKFIELEIKIDLLMDIISKYE